MKKIIFLVLMFFLSTSAIADDLDFLLKTNHDYDDVLVNEVRGINLITITNQEQKKEVVRLIGLKAPEIKKRNRPVVERDQYGFPVKLDINPESPVEEQAFNFVSNLLHEKRIRLEFDRTKKDDDFNTLAYVFLIDSDMFVNAEILKKGYSQLQVRPPNTKYKRELREAYQEARKNLLGFQGQ